MYKKLLFVFFLSLSLLNAKSFFIKLTPAGSNHRSAFIRNDFSTIPALKNIAHSSDELPQFSTLSKNISSLNNWLLFTAESMQNPVLNAMQAEGMVAHIEEVGYFKINSLNDSLVAKQWYRSKIGINKAWLKTKGQPHIRVAFIDTGIDYTHPDLVPALWINSAEDINNNGIFDAADNNQIDDDGNGLVDDVIGWDFTDAPRFADGGDYLTPDNDPRDEFGNGHGTQVAGIIAAQENNMHGIAGLAPRVKLITLRCGTASGYLEEDDVARAILYAVEKKAHIINMSFGDEALSRYLQDVIYYAYQQGVVLIASAGNSATDKVHYPSGLPEVISVGSSNENDGLAGFSNYGNTVDLIAPGTNIYSTAVDGKYNSVNGTSFSAPIVSAVSALLLSQNAELSVEQIRNILKTSSHDVLYRGWDAFSGAGRVDATKALNTSFAGELVITDPLQGASKSSTQIGITGSAAHPDLEKTVVSYGVGSDPQEWTILEKHSQTQIIKDTLAVLNASILPDTTITLRVEMQLHNSLYDEARVAFSIDRTAPKISNVRVIPLYENSQLASLITFETDDIAVARLVVFNKHTGSEKIISAPYETRTHRIKVDRDAFSGFDHFKIEVTNLGNLTAVEDSSGKHFNLKFYEPFVNINLKKKAWQLPAGYMYHTATDLDHDGKKEVILSRYDAEHGFGPIEIYEFENGAFELRLKTGFTAIPRAAGDVDDDGKSDLLFGYGQLSYLLEAVDASSFPTKVVWQDTVNFWAAAYGDLDKDGLGEIIGRKEDNYLILEKSGDNKFELKTELSNATKGQNRLGVPRVEINTVDGSGKDALIWGDYDGDILLYSSTADNQLHLIDTIRAAHSNATEMLTSDSTGYVVSATHTSDQLNYEHEFDARYWTTQIFKWNNGLKEEQRFNTFGFASTKDFDSGIALRKVDGRELLFLSFFPNIYIFEKNNGVWQAVWFNGNARSNTILVEDMDGDGFDEFYYNNGEQIVGYAFDDSDRPFTPQNFKVNPYNGSTVQLRWQAVPGAEHYNIYKGRALNNVEKWIEKTGITALDSSITQNERYYYRITATDEDKTISESYFAPVDSVFVIPAPNFTHLEYKNNRQIQLNFDAELALNQSDLPAAYLANQRIHASSLLLTEQKHALLISFETSLDAFEMDTLYLEGITGQFGTPLPKHAAQHIIQYEDPEQPPYISKYNWLKNNRLELYFSRAMQMQNINIKTQFKVTPSGGVHTFKVVDAKKCIIEFDDKTYLGASGQNSYIQLIGFKSVGGNELTGATTLSLFQDMTSLDAVFTYPQPLKPEHNKLIFANVPDDTEIYIYSLNGMRIKHINESVQNGGISWDLKDSNGKDIENGIYIYLLKNGNRTKQGKCVILR